MTWSLDEDWQWSGSSKGVAWKARVVPARVDCLGRRTLCGTRAATSSSTLHYWESKVRQVCRLARLGLLTLTLSSSVLNTVTNRVSRMLGTSETSRWLNLALFQGAPSKKGLKTLVSILRSRESPLNQPLTAAMDRRWLHRQILCYWTPKAGILPFLRLPSRSSDSTSSRDQNQSE